MPKHLVETILILCQSLNVGEDEQKILAFESLKPSHHPLIGKYNLFNEFVNNFINLITYFPKVK